MPELTAGRLDPLVSRTIGARRLVAFGRAALPRRRQPCWARSPGAAREPPVRAEDGADATQRPGAGHRHPLLTGPRPSLRSAKPPLPHAGAAGLSRREPGALLLQTGQTLLAHGVGRVIGGLHMQPAALAARVMATAGQATANHDRMHCAAQKCSCRSSASRLGAPVSDVGHARGRIQFFVCAVIMDRPCSVTAGVFRSSPAAGPSRVGRLVVASADGAEGLRGRLPGTEAGRLGMGPAAVPGQDLAEVPGPVGDGAVADLAARDQKMSDGHREAGT
jgi:hypothetical protein